MKILYVYGVSFVGQFFECISIPKCVVKIIILFYSFSQRPKTNIKFESKKNVSC